MKSLLLILLFSPLLSIGQKLVLIDRNFQQPLSIIDTITMEQATKGALPLYFKDLRSVISTMEWLIKEINSGKNNNKSFHLKIGNSKCIVKAENNGSRNIYNIVLNTNTGSFKTSIVLASHETSKRAAQRLSIFMDYLKNNIAAVPELKF